ncbi:MAG TPA: hypothetical protein VHG28_02025 [Longimicrobiaceae bacterium]|nr:hypothetical protein [Longimicrobiaceae bacterium]
MTGRRSETRGAGRRSRHTLVPVLLGLLAAAPPLAGQGAAGSGTAVSFRIGIAGGPGACRLLVVPGVEVRTPGRLRAVGVLDTYLFRVTETDPCRSTAEPAAPERTTYLPLAPPRLRLGAGWRGTMGELHTGARAYVGQQGVMEGFQPMAGAGVEVGSGPWAVGVDGTLHRGVVRERFRIPGSEYYDTRFVGTEWTPTMEVAARLDVGALTGSGAGSPRLLRPVLGGIAGGTVGALVGFGVGLGLNRGCTGDEICLIPALLGSIVGESLGVPLGVHLAEGRRGSLLLGAGASLGIAGVGLAGMAVLGDSGPPAQGIAVLVPVAQLAASIAIERGTARRR